jgi:FtsZ-interacting cell division protein ZipA
VAELRWILLGAGLLLILAVWVWGRRRSAAAADDTTAVIRGGDRYEPHLVDADDGHRDPHGHDDPHDPGAHGSGGGLEPEDLPTVEVPVRGYDERRAHGANPPVVTIDDLPDNVEDVVLIDAVDTVSAPAMRVEPPEDLQTVEHTLPVVAPRRLEPRMPERAREPEPAPQVDEPLHEQGPVREVLGDSELHDEPPTESFEVPTLSPSSAVPEQRRRPRPDKLPDVPLPPAPLVAADPLADTIVERQKRKGPAETVPRQQRIVAIRLIALGDRRIDGTGLKLALTAERLAFGRYSIFHRLLEGDRPVYSVASLVEPGSFDPELMGSQDFPGISMFAVFPGPLPAPQAFDELLATARRLADSLGGVLQDDSGSSLTGQRVLSLREELVHFEHLAGLSRGRPAG